MVGETMMRRSRNQSSQRRGRLVDARHLAPAPLAATRQSPLLWTSSLRLFFHLEAAHRSLTQSRRKIPNPTVPHSSAFHTTDPQKSKSDRSVLRSRNVQKFRFWDYPFRFRFVFLFVRRVLTSYEPALLPWFPRRPPTVLEIPSFSIFVRACGRRRSGPTSP